MYHQILFHGPVLNMLFNYTSVAMTLHACDTIHISDKNKNYQFSIQTNHNSGIQSTKCYNKTTSACDKK
jgi:ABC-type uncharacterized transport system auxiliary subunit